MKISHCLLTPMITSGMLSEKSQNTAFIYIARGSATFAMHYSENLIAIRLKAEREAEGRRWTKEALAEKLNVNRNTITRWERQDGKGGIPPLDDMLRMCELFDCELGYLLGEYDCKHRVVADVREVTGLSEQAITLLTETKELREFYQVDICSRFIENFSLWRNTIDAVKQAAAQPVLVPPSGVNNPLDDMDWIEPPVELFIDAGLMFYGQDAFSKFIKALVTDMRAKKGAVTNGDSTETDK